MKFKLTALLFLFTAINTFAQTADEIISKHIEAIGGKEKLLELNSMITEYNLDMQGNLIPITVTQMNNKGQRIDINIMGNDNYIIQTPTEGWTYMPVQGMSSPEATPAEVVKETSDALDMQGALLNYSDKGHKVEKLENEDFDGVDCLRLKLTMKNGLEQTLYFDPATFYILKSITKSKASGKEVEQVQTFSNYQKLESGYVFPFSMTGMGPGELTVSKIDINVPVDENVFKKPQ